MCFRPAKALKKQLIIVQKLLSWNIEVSDNYQQIAHKLYHVGRELFFFFFLDTTWWVIEHFRRNSVLSLTSFHALSPYGSLIESMRLAQQLIYYSSLDSSFKWALSRQLPIWLTHSSPPKGKERSSEWWFLQCCAMNFNAFSSQREKIKALVNLAIFAFCCSLCRQ